MRLSLLISIISICISVYTAEAQSYGRKQKINRFGAGIILGLTGSQIDGDDYTGYDLIQPVFGIEGSTHLSNYLRFDINFLYTRKGANIENELFEFRVNYPKDRNVHLDYIEVPLLFKILPHGEHSKLFFEGGVSINRMINSTINENIKPYTQVIFGNIEPSFNKTEIAAVAGLGSKIVDELSLGFRFSYGITKIYTNPSPIPHTIYTRHAIKQVYFLRNYYMNINLSYRIF